MEGFENKRKSLNIDDGKGRLVDQSPFTSLWGTPPKHLLDLIITFFKFFS
jgi:hypothetical protein